MPKISVLMGIYNTRCREYLEKSLNSILKQTYKDFELIICDDGSTNECLEWAKEICKNDKRVIFLKNDVNMGLAYTLNKCLKESKGKYIARMDDDDESYLNRFEKQLEYIKKENVQIVSCNIHYFDENGIYKFSSFKEEITAKDFLFNSPMIHPAVFGEKSAFTNIGGYNDNKYTVRVEDYDLFMRMYLNKVKMRVVPDILFAYRDDKANTIRRKKYKYRINEAIIRYKYFKKMKLFPKGLIYVVKPLIIGLLPSRLITFLKRIK